ncbi:protein ENHANCED DISEASE RESISTANCE 2-like [Andrographis paniculata]|uniref:protein ENHANCED DISEASE RESISTANCE 2-like n=1 Tax=Andrographis paniculata TaxID=175694 RepID=UPI0021E6F997|nr:protein ENHANCED DISEASE RESISTANCE 2-like [Andrographis paniculata]
MASKKHGSSDGGSPESVASETALEDRNSVHQNGGKASIRSHSSGREIFEYSGWVYHLGVNSIGHEYCHFRYLRIRGKYLEMYKQDPLENPGIKPIRKGTIGPALMVEELGRRKVNHGDVYVLRFFNRLDEAKKGEIACATAGEVRQWMEAFDQAKQQVEYELSRGVSVRNKLNMEDEINLEGHRPRVRRYAHRLKKRIRIGQGPEMLLRKTSGIGEDSRFDTFLDADGGDAVEAHEWRCVRTVNGVRIFEDVASSKSGKGILVKAVGVIEATADTVFDVVLNLDRHKRYEWDTLTSDLELVESIDGHYDVVYGTFDPRYLTWWQSKRDFVFSRQWFCGQDGTYTILQSPSIHKKRPPRSGYKRTKINPSTWEISNLSTPSFNTTARCLVTQTLEINLKGWFKWRNKNCAKFEKTVPFALLSQVSGLKEYVGANPTLALEATTKIFHSKVSDLSESNSEFEDAEADEEFYDATDDSSSEDEDNNNALDINKDKKIKLKNISWAIASLTRKRSSAPEANVLSSEAPPINLDASLFHGTLRKAKDEFDKNCWSSPDGSGFMIRGKTYLKDNMKVKGGEPLLKLIAVDWFQVEECATNVALHPKSLVQSAEGKKLPFILVINLEVPARPNYSLVLYFAADRPVNKDSLLGKFIDGPDMFRNSRFKLIPSIVEGYWMVKRAVGTKACLLGKAVTCKYLRQDNFLEIDVDIGSSSVARGVIGLVLGYVTSIVVDLAIVIEAKEEEELPEYILGTVRLNRIEIDSAVPLEGL